MDESMAYLECRCGACRVALSDPRVRFHIECLCQDCRQRVLIFNNATAGAPLPEALANYERGVDLYYFANALDVDRASRALLGYSKLRPDAFNTTASAQCCGTVMFGAHPAFEGRAVWATPDTCKFSIPVQMPAQFCLFSGDLPPEKLAVLRLIKNIPILGSGIEVMHCEELSALLSAVRTPLDREHTNEPYATIEQLYEGRPIQCNNDFFDEIRAVGMSNEAVQK